MKSDGDHANHRRTVTHVSLRGSEKPLPWAESCMKSSLPGACEAIFMEDLLFVLNLLVKLNLNNLCARACRNSPSPPPPHGPRWVGMSVHISTHAQICRDEPPPILPHLFPHHQQQNQTHIYGPYMHLKRMMMCLFSIGSLFHLG